MEPAGITEEPDCKRRYASQPAHGKGDQAGKQRIFHERLERKPTPEHDHENQCGISHPVKAVEIPQKEPPLVKRRPRVHRGSDALP